jgi:hypothetical protein
MIRLALHFVLVEAFAGLAAAELGQSVNLTQLWRRDDISFDQVFTTYSRPDRGGCHRSSGCPRSRATPYHRLEIAMGLV